jgi:predicted acyltransferase
MNSIAIYCMAQLLKPWVATTLRIHLGQGIFQGTYFGRELFAPIYAPIVQSMAVLLVLWLICWWMYRSKIFIKI